MNQLVRQNGKVEVSVGSPSWGTSTIAVLVKRSFQIVENAPAQRLSEDAPFRRVDQYYDEGDPSAVTLQHESELAPLKALTDFVVIGNAYAPQGRPCHQMSVRVSINSFHKQLLITGDRVCRFVVGSQPAFSEPTPFTCMPIRYERAYGGVDETSDPNLPFRYPRNDKGVGLALKNVKETIEGLRLPNIEDPADLLVPERVVIGDPNLWHMQPLPQGLGWRHPSWFPRCCLVGSYPAFLDVGVVTQEEKLGMLPDDYVSLAKQMRLAPNMPLFANGASLGMSFERVDPGAKVALQGLTPKGDLAFSLPTEVPEIALNVGHTTEKLEPRLFTVSVQPDEMRLNMIWAGHYHVGPFAQWSQITNLQAEVT